MDAYLAMFVSMLAMTAIVGLRYAAVSGGFAWLTRRRFPGLYRGLGPQMRREIGWSLASAAIYGAPAGLLAWGWQAHGWTRVYPIFPLMAIGGFPSRSWSICCCTMPGSTGPIAGCIGRGLSVWPTPSTMPADRRRPGQP